MSNHNRYFITELTAATINSIYGVCVESSGTTRQSNDGLLGVVKLPVNDNGTYDCLSAATEYTYGQIKTEMLTANWSGDTL